MYISTLRTVGHQGSASCCCGGICAATYRSCEEDIHTYELTGLASGRSASIERMFVDTFHPPEPDVGPLAERPLEQLEHEICELLGAHLGADLSLAGLVAEFDCREGWASWGVASCADWLAWKCAISPATAREHVRVARALTGLPLLRAAFARGELSYSKARALTRVATADSEGELVEFAALATAAQLERVVRAYKRVKRLEDAQGSHRARFVSHHWDEDGSLVISGRLPAEQGALVLTALKAAKDALDAGERAIVSAETIAAAQAPTDTGDVSAETSAPPADGVRREAPDYPAGARAADALVLMADTLLAHGPAARGAADRHQVLIHIDAETLATRREEDVDDGDCEHCELEDGPALHPETVRRLACDAGVVAISAARRQHARRRAQDTHDPARAAARAERPRPRLPVPRLQPHPLPAGASHRALGARRAHRPGEPDHRLQLPSPAAARGRLQRRTHADRRVRVPTPRRRADPRGATAAARRTAIDPGAKRRNRQHDHRRHQPARPRRTDAPPLRRRRPHHLDRRRHLTPLNA